MYLSMYILLIICAFIYVWSILLFTCIQLPTICICRYAANKNKCFHSRFSGFFLAYTVWTWFFPWNQSLIRPPTLLCGDCYKSWIVQVNYPWEAEFCKKGHNLAVLSSYKIRRHWGEKNEVWVEIGFGSWWREMTLLQRAMTCSSSLLFLSSYQSHTYCNG